MINPETRKPFHLGYQPPKQWVPLYNSAQKISTKDSNHPRQHINLKVNHSWIRDMALKFIKPKLYVHFSNETRDRSSHGRSSVREGVLRHLAKFTGKHLCQSLFFKKVAGLRRNSFTEHLRGLLPNGVGFLHLPVSLKTDLTDLRCKNSKRRCWFPV